MRLDDCCALLDVPPGAPADEVKRAHRDLAKVWHPDRFANDAALRRKAEEKLENINEACETILASRGGPLRAGTPPDAGRVADRAAAVLRRIRIRQAHARRT